MWKNKYLQWSVWAIGVAGLVSVNVWLYHNIHQRIRTQNYQIFLDIVLEAESDIQNKFRFYGEILWGAVGLFNASESVDREEWSAYTRALELDRYPGINGIGFIEFVEGKEIIPFLREARTTVPEFTLKKIEPSDSKEHFVIRYIEPLEKNKEALGLDIASESARRKAAVKSRNTGQATLTAPITLVQDETRSPGFLVLLPVYKQELVHDTLAQRKKHFLGWVYAPFIAKNFLKDTLHTDRYLDFTVRVLEEDDRDTLIYQQTDSSDFPEFRAKSLLSMGNQQWEIEWRSTPGLSERFSSYGMSRLTWWLGTLVTVLVAVISGFLVFRIQRSQQRVRQAQTSLAESEAKFSEAFENAAIGIALSDLDGKFIRVNRSLCEMLGYTKVQLLDKTTQDITYPEDQSPEMPLAQGLIENHFKSFTLKKRYQTKKQSIIWVRLNVSLVRDAKGAPKYFVSEIENITREKLLDDIKSDFISISSHQFRTPLSGIRWNLESLLDGGLKEYSVRKVKVILQEVLSSVLRMNDLVKDLLRVSKLESGLIQAQLTPQDLKKTVRGIVTRLKGLATVKGQKIVVRRYEKSVIARADRRFLSEILEILLQNAIEYAPDGSEISIEFETRKQFVILHVNNLGKGFSSKEQKLLFEKFSRLAHGASQNPNGSGLGLFIAKNLAELMDGTLAYDGKNEGLIRFTLKLPREKS